MSNVNVLVQFGILVTMVIPSTAFLKNICWKEQAQLSSLPKESFIPVNVVSLESCKKSCKFAQGCRFIIFNHEAKECYKSKKKGVHHVELIPGDRFVLFLQRFCDNSQQ